MMYKFYKDELPLYGSTRREDKNRKKWFYCGVIIMWGSTAMVTFYLGYYYRDLICMEASLMDEL